MTELAGFQAGSETASVTPEAGLSLERSSDESGEQASAVALLNAARGDNMPLLRTANRKQLRTPAAPLAGTEGTEQIDTANGQ